MSWHSSNRKHINSKAKKYRKENESYWNSQLKYKFGITLEDYNSMFSEQNGCCKICNKHQTDFKARFCVDHDHETNIVRGLLCRSCNLLLGFANDSIENLYSAIDYLANNRVQSKRSDCK